MKDVFIPGKAIRKELIVFAVCFILAAGINLFAIVYYQTHWTELFSTIHVTLAIAVILYVIAGAIRLFGIIVSRIYSKGKSASPNRNL